MPDINTGAPLDTDLVSNYPANERASRAAIASIIGAEHNQTTGRHKIGIGNAAARDAITDWERGSVWCLNEGGGARQKLQVQQQASSPFVWTDQAGEFGSGVHMLFAQAAAPTGWVQDTAWHDRVLRIVNAPGGATGGSWTITGLTVPRDGWPVGLFGASSNAGRILVSDGAGSGLPTNIRQAGGDNTSATFDGNWRPQYLDVISCQKI